MSTTQSMTIISVPANADLSASQFKLAVINATGKAAVLAVAGDRADGVIMNKPSSAGLATELAVGGLVKVQAGGAITPGGEVASGATGLAVAAVAEDYVFGIYKGDAACASGDFISVLVTKYQKNA